MPCRAGSGKALSPEELQTRARNMFTEYANVGDAKDALQTARELADTNTPQCLSKMIEHGLEEVFNALKVRWAASKRQIPKSSDGSA